MTQKIINKSRQQTFTCIILVFLLFITLRTPAYCEKQNARKQFSKPYVLLISIDGYRHDYTDIHKPAFLSKFKKKYSGSTGLIPVFPSKTFTNHYSIITGMYAENHGIVSNEFLDPEKKQRYSIRKRETVKDGRWYGGVPIWAAAENQGMLTASYFWVGSEADILSVKPSYYYVYDSNIPYMERARQVIRWLKLPPDKRPHFITLYFSVVDSMGHRHGPESIETKKGIKKVDKVLKWLYKKIKRLKLPVNTIIVSDHGMIAIEPGKIENLDDYVDLSDFHTEIFGTHGLLYSKKQSPSDVQRVYERLKMGAKYFAVFKREELPAAYHLGKNSRAGDIIVIAQPGALVTLKQKGNPHGKGTHGYPPFQTDKMNGIFYCSGPGIRSGIKLEPFENIHIYPFIMKLLELKMPEKNIDGNINVLSPLFKKR